MAEMLVDTLVGSEVGQTVILDELHEHGQHDALDSVFGELETIEATGADDAVSGHATVATQTASLAFDAAAISAFENESLLAAETAITVSAAREASDANPTTSELVTTLNAASPPPVDAENDVLSDTYTSFADSSSEHGQEVFVREGGLVLATKDGQESQLPFDAEPLLLAANDSLSGNGSIQPPVINQGGLVSPGNSPGIQDFGSFTQGTDGTLLIEIAGYGNAGEANGFDLVNVSGHASLGGALQVQMLGGFQADVGSEFTFLSFGSVAGDFDSFYGLGLGNGRFLQPILNPASSGK